MIILIICCFRRLAAGWARMTGTVCTAVRQRWQCSRERITKEKSMITDRKRVQDLLILLTEREILQTEAYIHGLMSKRRSIVEALRDDDIWGSADEARR